MVKKRQSKPALFISHNLFLTTEERKILLDNGVIRTIGCSVPTWFNPKNSKTSEPSSEIFCEYVINDGEDDGELYIHPRRGRYYINIPRMPRDYDAFRLSDEEFFAMTDKELADWYKANPVPKTVKNLADFRDGGSAYLRFHENDKVKTSLGMVKAVHIVEIKTFESLKNSLV